MALQKMRIIRPRANRLDGACRHERRWISLALLAVFVASLLAVEWERGVLQSGSGATLQRLGQSLLHADFSATLMRAALHASLLTFSYALIALSLAVVVGFGLGLVGAGVLFRQRIWAVGARAVLGALRAIHELIWAWFFVAAVGLNPIGAVFALAIPYSGYLGKIFADSLQSVPSKPIIALRQTGASAGQLLWYGYLPQALPTMLSYTMYRLECAIRSSSVLSFVGLGGIGMQIQLALQDLRYEQVWGYLLCLMGLIWAIDRWSQAMRRRIR